MPRFQAVIRALFALQPLQDGRAVAIRQLHCDAVAVSPSAGILSPADGAAASSSAGKDFQAEILADPTLDGLSHARAVSGEGAAPNNPPNNPDAAGADPAEPAAEAGKPTSGGGHCAKDRTTDFKNTSKNINILQAAPADTHN